MGLNANRKLSRIIITLILASLSAFAGYVTAKAWNGSRSIFISGRNPLAQVASFLFSDNNLIGEGRGQVNILLLGVGGAGHDGPYLSDTIMLASVRPGDKEIGLVSIPRDTLVSIPGHSGFYKINHVYALTTAKYGPRTGLTQTREAIGKLLGVDIPYAVVVDFDGFIDAVNNLGGIDVRIDNTFTDSRYPNNKLGYLPPVTFKAGVEHMDGNRSLIYARSRYSTSDFDRARRQQRIIEAFTTKVRNLDILKDITTINKLFDDFTSHIVTNFEPGEVRRLGQIATEISSERIYTSVLDPTTGLVCSYTSTELGYHLNPCPGKNAEAVHKYVETQFARGHVKAEKPVVEIQNATFITGLALAAAQQLQFMAFQPHSTNAGKIVDARQTVIYDLTGGRKPDSLAVLLVTLNAKVGKTAPVVKTASNPDFIIVLGNDYKPPYLDVINLDPPKPKTSDPDKEESQEDGEAAKPDDLKETSTEPSGEVTGETLPPTSEIHSNIDAEAEVGGALETNLE